MPRQARLDAPRLLQHVMGRGIERRKIFRDDKDRASFLERLAVILEETQKGRRQKAEVRSRSSVIMPMLINSAKDLKVYKTAYDLAMAIYEISKKWPMEEKYSLTDQVRRSSRSVCSNLREAWAKRRYEAHFISKLTDSDGENSETDTWLDFARDCGYLSIADHDRLTEKCRSVGKMLGSMPKNPESFIMRL